MNRDSDSTFANTNSKPRAAKGPCAAKGAPKRHTARLLALVSVVTFHVLVGGSTPSARATAGEPLTVMTWNLEWFFDNETGDNYSKLAREKSTPSRAQWDWRRDAIAASIAKANPTVVAVQEAENRRVLWYLARALERNHKQNYRELGIQGRDHYTEQDVGMLFRSPASLLNTVQYAMTDRMRKTEQYYDVSKHLMAVFEFPVGDSFERVIVFTLHLRSGADAEPLRRRQARLVHHWIGSAVAAGEHVIVLGDLNTEQRGHSKTNPDSDLGILSGSETRDKKDDLVDLNLTLARHQRQTHLLAGREFDRIFCSPSLMKDIPGKPNLVFQSIEVRADLAIQGPPDTASQHWDAYWKQRDDQRDLSDHYPVIATFEVK